MNKYRKFITSSVGFTFVVVAFTGLAFKFFFKTHAMEEIHGWIGTAMVLAAAFHVSQNWGQLQKHLRDKRVFLLLFPIFLVIGFFAFAPKEEKRGVSPRELMNRLAKGKAAEVATVLGKDVDSVVALMKSDGILVESADVTIELLAQQNQRPPEEIFSYFVK